MEETVKKFLDSLYLANAHYGRFLRQISHEDGRTSVKYNNRQHPYNHWIVLEGTHEFQPNELLCVVRGKYSQTLLLVCRVNPDNTPGEILLDHRPRFLAVSATVEDYHRDFPWEGTDLTDPALEALWPWNEFRDGRLYGDYWWFEIKYHGSETWTMCTNDPRIYVPALNEG